MPPDRHLPDRNVAFSFHTARPERHNSHVLEIHRESCSILALFDSCGAWSEIPEATEEVVNRLGKRWKELFPQTVDELSNDMTRLATQVSRKYPKDDWVGVPCPGAVAARFQGNGEVYLVHAGYFDVCHRRDGRGVHRIQPQTWVADQVELGNLFPEDAREHPMRHIFRGPGLCSEVKPPSYGPWEVLPGDAILLGPRHVLEVASSDDIDECLRCDHPAERLSALCSARTNERGTIVVVVVHST